ncbi:hypothetical protein DO97_04430 [Neosynechococcus sphagnicola sy1]|uniref:Uncharacterized protein n=1 Tax=Neosynechococcus sphagnicola sy1 TaxID=1497020 RepID=A0A098TQ35_9CYAN|nr:hypothetical protein [Neosynechococcus sphagnicola]KGF72938.1 hypothetical protein DO97_04430 [Neosynechococcus sphagnicola sy1]
MSTPQHAQTVQKLLRAIWKLPYTVTQRFMTWLLRSLVLLSQQSKRSLAGFVLPTVMILLLIVTLVTSTLLFRAFNRSTQVISERQKQVIVNAVTPAIDRAKAKLEYLFNNDTRLPSGEPAEDALLGILLNNGAAGVAALTNNPYNLPGETRKDIDGDGNEDTAWSFPIDSNADGVNDATIVYGIFLRAASADGTVTISDDPQPSDTTKANNLMVRNGPRGAVGNVCQVSSSGTLTQAGSGWFKSSTGISRKNFQIFAVAVPTSATGFATLQYQQDREIKPGNTYASWFRTDLMIQQTPPFTSNGRVHTEGSLFLYENGSEFRSYMVSAPASCFYLPVENSDITIRGLLAAGNADDNTAQSSTEVKFDIHPGTTTAPPAANTINLNPTTGSATASRDAFNPTGAVNTFPLLTQDPLALLINDQSKPRGVGSGSTSYTDYRDTVYNSGSTEAGTKKVAGRVQVLTPKCPPLCG